MAIHNLQGIPISGWTIMTHMVVTFLINAYEATPTLIPSPKRFSADDSEAKAISKRDTAGYEASSFIHMQQSRYRFALPKCSPGTPVGKVVAGDQRKAAIHYVIETPSSDVAVNQNTGQLLLINYIQLGVAYEVVVRAISTSGSSFANVTFGCGAFSSTASQSPSSSPNKLILSPNSPLPAAYTFTTKACTPGSPVGILTAPSSSGCIFASIYPSSFYSVISSGVVQLDKPTATTEMLLVRTTCQGQVAATAMVTITSSCSSVPTAQIPTFSLPVYNFFTSKCMAGEPIGTIAASNAVVYVVEPMSAHFNVGPTTGIIQSSGPLTNADYTFTVKAYSSTRAIAVATIKVTSPNCAAPSAGLQFYADAYTFSPTNCSADVFIGQVGTTGGLPGRSSFSVDNPTGSYSIGLTSGAITAVGEPAAGTMRIRAMNSGKTITVPVTIILGACDPASSSSSPSSSSSSSSSVRRMGSSNPDGPVFGMKNYVMTVPACVAGTIAGQVFATSRRADGDVSYSLESENVQVQVDKNSGVISLMTSQATSPVQTAVLAIDSAGNANNVPVTIKCGSSSIGSSGNGNGNRLGTDHNRFNSADAVTAVVPDEISFPVGVDLG
ncbi:hypothetical protein BV898_03806 [Hypsibius exemplaris]|uniref:Cadherin domain-containing protein n=1 Tax=Hypsibius exemplaris TaxID=2072580 RepID=A0A1W0X493_HYPEX|nr:hypothetical protein BV898_03806 [Hypsibius exemplaris]